MFQCAAIFPYDVWLLLFLIVFMLFTSPERRLSRFRTKTLNQRFHSDVNWHTWVVTKLRSHLWKPAHHLSTSSRIRFLPGGFRHEHGREAGAPPVFSVAKVVDDRLCEANTRDVHIGDALKMLIRFHTWIGRNRKSQMRHSQEDQTKTKDREHSIQLGLRFAPWTFLLLSCTFALALNCCPFLLLHVLHFKKYHF